MKDFLGELEKLCGDNYIWVFIGCAVLLLIIIAALCKTFAGKSKGNPDLEGKDENREFFLEGEYDSLLRQQALSKAEPADVEMLRKDLPGQQKSAEANKTEAVTEENENESAPDKAMPAAGGDDVESMQPLQIKIDIRQGQVKIGYCAGEEMSYRVGAEDKDAEVKAPEAPEVPEVPAKPEETEEPGMPEVPEKVGAPEAPEAPVAHEVPETLDKTGKKPFDREIIMEKINIVKGTPTGKFGPDNMNTTRSGRVYTEEELRRLIK